jgi:hypothetical protein
LVLPTDFAGSQYGAPFNAPVQAGIRAFYMGVQHPLLALAFTKDRAFIHIGSYFAPFSDYAPFATGVPARQGLYFNGAHSDLFEARAQVYW